MKLSFFPWLSQSKVASGPSTAVPAGPTPPVPTESFTPGVATATPPVAPMGVVMVAPHAKPPAGVPKDFHQVTDNMYRGAAPTEADVPYLKGLGINTLIDLRGPADPPALDHDPSFKYIHIPCHADPAPSTADILTFLKAVTATNPTSPPVFYVHCKHGEDRTGLMIAAYRMVVQGWTSKQAMTELKADGWHPELRDIEHAVQHMPVDQLRQELG